MTNKSGLGARFTPGTLWLSRECRKRVTPLGGLWGRGRKCYPLLLTLLLLCLIYVMYLEPPLDEFLTTPTVTTRGTGNSYTNQKDVGELMEILHGRVERLSGKWVVEKLPDDTLKEDPKKPTWQLWKDDPACSHYYTRFGKGLTPVQLVSVPSSGSTWLRYLLEASTGFFTGSNYNDTLLYKEGFLGEKGGVHDGGTLVQRTHGAAWFLLYLHDLQDRYDYINSSIPTILLLRDPAR
ncbi:hypothetical protein Pmani_001116 [Petrolisthes manimaculis]|uniref:Sulfotransferase n=1 Tax=Petrolisthes manimaculis TaxID=1843537 RepID=A0AAE1QL57_9EUCA|nr:hypothetical protein Pmani_001116 [Petrolisthes manimaculis]